MTSAKCGAVFQLSNEPMTVDQAAWQEVGSAFHYFTRFGLFLELSKYDFIQKVLVLQKNMVMIVV